MKHSKIYLSALCLGLLMTISSCSFIAGVFKTGMGVGIAMVVIILVIVFAIISRAGKK